MTSKTLALPPGTVNCRGGNYLVQRIAGDVWKVFQVEELVVLGRLIPIGGRAVTEFIEERHAMDSERPMAMDEIRVLLTAFDATFVSEDTATEAIRSNALGASVQHVCLDLRQFPATDTTIHLGAPERGRG